jgi:hypothetical protein
MEYQSLVQKCATQLLKLTPYKITVIHALHPRDPANRVHFCSWFLQTVVECGIDPQLTFFSVEVWFHLQRYINMQNNRYWSSLNPLLTHEVAFHPVKAGVWCAVRKIDVPSFLTKQLIAKHKYMSFSSNSFLSYLSVPF